MDQLELPLRLERQLNPVADEVSALTAVIRPILTGLLFGLKEDVAKEVGGHNQIKLKMLPRLYRRSDGDIGVCFEYAVHDAITRNDPLITERVNDALSRHCGVPGQSLSSILFAAERSGRLQLIETAKERLTPESSLLYGSAGRPVKLMKHIDTVARAFKRAKERERLPQSIRGLWKADLFAGFLNTDRWVGTTVKINRHDLEPARGLRVGIVPAAQGGSDHIIKDLSKNLVICPLPYDGSFMEIFYRAWGIVKQFVAADAYMPKDVALPLPPDRNVAKLLVDRREFLAIDVIEALGPLAQPELLKTEEHTVAALERRHGRAVVGAAVAPIANTKG